MLSTALRTGPRLRPPWLRKRFTMKRLRMPVDMIVQGGRAKKSG
jgi:hypothetical protein